MLNANQPSPVTNVCGFAVCASLIMPTPSSYGSKVGVDPMLWCVSGYCRTNMLLNKSLKIKMRLPWGAKRNWTFHFVLSRLMREG